MSSRRSLKLPITLGVVMIVLLVALTVGWVILSVREALAGTRFSGLYWTLLSVGTVFLVLVLVGVVIYLSLSIKAINLTQRQSNFIDSVTHELKSPIASLKLYLQTLEHRQVPEAKQADFYRFMLDDVERLDRLINHLLDAARVEQQPVDGTVEEVELSLLLRGAAEAVCLAYRVAPQTVRCDAVPAVVRGSPFEIDLVFRNLIDNAVKYAGNPPEVEIACRPLGEKVVVSITDNGRGIPHKLRRTIFGRFVRLGRELERDKPGTGLGLYIVRTLVKRMRGTITVRDREGCTGTVFEVQLPGRAAPAAPVEIESPVAVKD